MKIFIIGCGFAGLSSALLLSKKGHNITLFDQFKKVEMIGAGLLLQPSSIPVLKLLNIYDKIEKIGEKIYSLNGKNHFKKTVFETNYLDYQKDSFGIGIHRSELFNLLYEECLKQENISFSLGKHIDDINTLKKECDLLIIANGSHSKLREQMPIKQSYKLYPYGCVWTTINDEYLCSGILQQYMKYSKEMFGILPSGLINNKRKVSIFWSLPISNEFNYSKENIIKEMSKFVKGRILEKVGNENFIFAKYADVTMKTYNYENIVVIGDAAHGMSPQLGQGANMAFLDSYYLSKVLDETNLEKSLSYYTLIRKKHLKFYTQASKFLTPLFQSNSILNGLIRDVLFLCSKNMSITKKFSSAILCGKKLSWLNNKEIKY